MELRSRKLSDEPAPSTGETAQVGSRDLRNSAADMTESSAPPARYPLWQVTAAWLVHFYTATGLLVNMYSLLFALFSAPRAAPNFSLFAKLNWLAIFIDATDGTLARAVDIKKVVPTYDGALLDNIIDYQTFAILPALSVIVFQIVPGTALQFFVASVVLISAAYQFCQTLAKTPEAFVGFPSYWNIVVFYIYYLRPSLPVTLLVFGSCAVLSFVPMHFIYPTRTEAYFKLNLYGAYAWAMLLIVPTFFPHSRYVRPALYLSFLYVVYYFGVSYVLDSRRRKEEMHKE